MVQRRLRCIRHVFKDPNGVSRLRVGVVGAGVAGLSAARLLHKSGHEVLVFERSGDIGGRCATRTVDQYVFDTGATSIAPRGKVLEPVLLNELDTSELVLVPKPIYIHTSLRVAPGDVTRAKLLRYTYKNGNATLGKLLAAGLNVRLNAKVEAVEKDNGLFRIGADKFDALVLACPIPETAALLETMGEQRSINHVHYRPCLSVLLGYDKEMPEVKYHAIIDPEQRHPLTWLSLESEKCPGRAPEAHTAMVAQLSPQFSATYYDSEDGAIVAATVEYVERLYGQAWSSPVAFDVKRWRYSQPENLALFYSVNQPRSKVLIASDGLIGGRVEYAYEAGARVAKMLNGEE